MSSSNIKFFPLWCLNWVLCILNKNKGLNYIFCSFHVLEPQKFRLLFCMMSAQSWTWSTKSIRVLTTSLGPSSGISWNRNKLVAFLWGYGCNRVNIQFVVHIFITHQWIIWQKMWVAKVTIVFILKLYKFGLVSQNEPRKSCSHWKVFSYSFSNVSLLTWSLNLTHNYAVCCRKQVWTWALQVL